MNYFTGLEDLKNYRDVEAVSQSYLKLVLANNVNKKFKETIPMLVGSYLDSLLSSPDLTDDLFQVGLAKRPSESMKEFIDTLWQEQEEEISADLNVEGYKKRVVELAREAKYQPRWGDDAIWNNVLKDCESYWSELCTSQGKILMTQEEHDNSINTAQLACSSSITGKYFQDQEDIDKYYQMPLYWTYEKLPCKGLLDILIFEKETKTIYIIDIKSTGVSSLREWFNVCRQKNYPFQLAWYKEGVIANYPELIEEGWKIECRWIVIPTGFFKPWIVPCTEVMLKFGKKGYFKSRTNYYDHLGEINAKDKFEGQEYIPGFEKAIHLYKAKEEFGLLDYDTEYYFTNGKLDNTQTEQYYFI